MKFTDEHRAKLSAAHKGKTPWNKGLHTPGHPHSEEVKAKISAAMMGNKHQAGRVVSNETRMKLSLSNRGQRRSAETRAKLSASLIGRDAWNKGKKGVYSAETKERQRISHLGNKNALGHRLSEESRRRLSKSLRGRISPRKGVKLSFEQIARLAEFNRGKPSWNKGISPLAETRKKISISLKSSGITAGANNPAWKGGVTILDKRERNRFKKTMQPIILARDNYTCLRCGARGCYLHVDHIKPWKDFPELRFVESNCRTLCMDCHYYVTFNREMPKGLTWGGRIDRRVAS